MYSAPPLQQSVAHGDGAIRGAVREVEERFVDSALTIYERAVMRGDEGASAAVDRFFRPSSIEEYSVRTFANVMQLARLQNLLNSSRLDPVCVVYDMLAVLYAVDVHAVEVVESAGVGPLQYEHAGIPMTILNEVDHKAIDALPAEEREAVLARVRDVDLNRRRRSEAMQAAGQRSQIRRTAQWLATRYTKQLDRDSMAAAVARRTETTPAAIRMWLADLDAEEVD